MSKKSNIDVVYIVTTVEDSSALERKIGTVGALRNAHACYVCKSWQEARTLWREHYVRAYRAEYSAGLLVSLEQKRW